MRGYPVTLDSLLLIAMALGYVVLYLAKREDKALQAIGYVIGAVIVCLSMIYLLSNAMVMSSYQKNLRASKGLHQAMPMPMRGHAR